MKRLIFFGFLFISVCVLGQEIDYNKIILPRTAGENIDFEERLVQLAWLNHPENSIARRQVEIATQDLKMSNRDWLDIFHVQFNIHEFNINPATDVMDRASFYPRYNVGARIPLGYPFINAAERKKRNEMVEVTKDELNAQKLRVRQEVLQSYNNYLMYKEIFSIQSLALDDAENSHLLIEGAFEKGEESFNRYITSLNILNRIKIAKIDAENDFQNAKLAVEALIGLSLEEVN